MGKLTDKVTKMEAEITSASMADIAFLLIIFFMVTTVFSATKGLDFKLPSDDQTPPTTEREEAVFFKVLEDGSFLMDGRPAVREDIIPYLAPKLERWPEKPIILYARRQAPYKAMVAVYDELQKTTLPPERGGLGLSKLPNISIPTNREIQQYIALFGVNPFEDR
ncbi:MAG TPA: biopolymer transporter ExbD [Acidobacteria bacterium]|nr:biopolymer transporter ExbD [Acidobacteriota bacterium]